MLRHPYTLSGKVQYFDTHTVSREYQEKQLQADHRERKAFFSPYFLKMDCKIVALQDLRFVTSCVQDFIVLVLHAALLLHSQEFYIVCSIPFVQQLEPVPTRCHNVYS